MEKKYKPKITVIVPVYNNEMYLKQCVDSVTSQTLKEIEILLIDDGSNDKSRILCDEYAKLDSRIRVIHKKNEGLGLTRNRGMAEARGEYFTFLDSDDFVATDLYERLYSQAKKWNADSCVCGVTRVFSGNRIPWKMKLDKEVYIGQEIQQDLLYKVIGSSPSATEESVLGYSMCSGIYKLDIVKRNNMKFYSEREYKLEDVLFKIEYFSYMNSFTYIEDPSYFYRSNENSLTKKYRSDVINATLKSYNKEFELLEELGVKEGKLYATRMLLSDLRGAMRMIAAGNSFSDTRREFINLLKKSDVIEVISTYPYHQLPIAKRIWCSLLVYKKCTLLTIIMKLLAKIKS